MKQLVAAVLILASTQTIAQQISRIESKKSNADIAWESKPDFGSRKSLYFPQVPTLSSEEYPIEDDKEKLKKYYHQQEQRFRESYGIELRNWGIDFWNKYPNDKRRYQWLKETITWSYAPYYFLNMNNKPLGYENGVFVYPIDQLAMGKWKNQYQLMRNEFMNSPHMSELEKLDLLELELCQDGEFFSKQKHIFVRNNRTKFDVKNWTKNILTFASDYYRVYSPGDSSNPSLYYVKYNNGIQERDKIIQTTNLLFWYSIQYGLNYKDLEELAKSFANSGFVNLRRYAQGKLQLLALRNKPFELKFKALDGKDIDLAKMRGSLILLDFWATSCSSCIQKMPEIKSVYEKYQHLGFEVISICLNPEMDKEKVLSIHTKIGAGWPMLLIGGVSARSGYMAQNSLAKKIWDEYGFKGVPQLLLIGRDGVLKEYQGQLLQEGKLETVVKKYLNN